LSTKKEYTITEAIEALAPQIDPELDIVQVRILNVGKSVKLRVYVDYPGGVTFDVLKTSQA
jgi:ribosome maturation factor RimP